MFKLKKAPIFLMAALSTLMACNSGSPQTDHSKNQASAKESPQQKQDTKKISEALGNFIGRNLHAPGVQFDIEAVVKGLRDGAAGKPSPMSDEEYEKALTELQETANKTLAANNLKEANVFMENNKKTQGVVEAIPGKLEYIVLEEGKGPAVPEHGTPLLNYVGRYLDGTVFGSSENTGGPVTVSLDQTVPGFSKGVEGMKEGEKRRIFVHPEIGYGTSGQLIPNAVLVFDVEILKSTSPEADESEGTKDADKKPAAAQPAASQKK